MIDKACSIRSQVDLWQSTSFRTVRITKQGSHAYLCFAIALAVSLFACTGWADPRPYPLRTFSPAQIQSMETLLNDGDVSLIESTPNGKHGQITTFSFVNAPAELVWGVVAHPERYGDFVRNMEKCSVQKYADGSLEHSYSINYTITRVFGRHRYVFLPKESSGSLPSIDMTEPEDGATRHYRWEFIPVPRGTLLVLYGYTNMPDEGLVNRLTSSVPSLEYGLALITQMTQQFAMKKRAEQLAGIRTIPALNRTQGGYHFLLERGVVVLTRTQNDRLSGLNLIDQARAKIETLLQIAGEPSAWSKFVPSITLSRNTGEGSPQKIELEQTLPLMSWRTNYGVMLSRSSVDLMGLSGDLRDARIRWDFQSLADDKTQIVLRISQDFQRSSMVIRQLYKLEPLFEYGINVGMSLLLLWGVKWRAEQVQTQKAT